MSNLAETILRDVRRYDAYDVMMTLDGHPLPGGRAFGNWVRYSEVLAALTATDATEKGGDAHDRRLRSHEASPGVTAGADAAQAREAALWEAWNVVWEAKTLLDAKNALHALIGEART